LDTERLPSSNVLQEMNRPDCEPHGVGAEYELVKAATDLPINWTQDGTEMLLGQQRCQGGNSRIASA